MFKDANIILQLIYDIIYDITSKIYLKHLKYKNELWILNYAYCYSKLHRINYTLFF